MLIIAGYARTGTSILFKCLERSGFYGGSQDQLFGHHYKSQHKEFGDINKQILFWMRTQMLSVPLRGGHVPEELHGVLKELGTEMEEQGINMVKDPQAAPLMQLWLDVVPQFQNPRFIKIEREPLDVAKSCVRLWSKQGWLKRQGRKDLTVSKVKRIYKFEDRLWDVTIKNHPHIRLQYEDLFSKNGTQDKVSEFIGQSFDMSLINPKKTYKASRQIY